jgi:hypothetical protein
MSHGSALSSPAVPLHGSVYSAVCLGLAGAGIASGRLLEALLLIVGVVASVALSTTTRAP